MSDAPHCLTADDLRRFLLGQLAEADADEVERHLAGCSRCLDTISAMQASDTLVDAMRQQVAAGPPPEADVVERIVARLSDLHPGAAPSAGLSAPPAASRQPVAWSAEQILAPPQSPDELGRLGGYRILRVLGIGGMGIVFEADDPQLHRRVALKALKPELAARPADRQRFLREARAMAAIEHDHIVTIHQVGDDRGLPFLAMPLLKGQTLEDSLRRAEGASPLMTIVEILRIGRELAAGLAAAHEQGLTHRDIKPANLWIEASGRLKILDFGLARPEQDDSHLTQTGLVAGTPQYMAPEQATGQHVDHLADLFSLGCVLYRLSTGRLPFTGNSTLAVLRALALEQPPPPRELNPAVPRALSDLTMRLLAKEPRERPQTAKEVADSLGEIEKVVGILRVPSGGNGTRSVPSTINRRRVVWIAAALLLLLSSLAAWYGPTVYRFVTDQGLLIIQTEDPAVELTVKQGGKLIQIVDRKSGHEITLQSGTYELALAAGQEGLKLETDHFTLRRGRQEIAHVRREPTAPAAAPGTAVPSTSPAPPFAILGRDGKSDQPFAALAGAIVAAQSGDVIEVRGNGPMIKEPIFVSGKALTIRAAPGGRPVLEFSPASLGEGRDKYVRLQTDAPLVLEGLEIRRVGPTGEKVKRAEWAVVCRKAPLRVANCRFVVSTQPGTVALWADESALCEVRNCDFALGPGCPSVDWVCPATGRLIWDNNLLVGGSGPNCHLRWIVHDVAVQLTHSTFLGPALNVDLDLPPQAALGEENQPAPPLRVDAAADVFHPGCTFGFYQGFPLYAPGAKALPAEEAEALLRRLVAWQGQRNVFAQNENLIRLGAVGESLNMTPLEPTRVRSTLEDFRQFWGSTEAGSLQGRILHQGEQVATKAATAPDELSPGDFRLHSGSVGFHAGADGRDLGADVDLVGPGAAYERWKLAPVYQEWLKPAGQTP